jgi:hypothetical protein
MAPPPPSATFVPPDAGQSCGQFRTPLRPPAPTPRLGSLDSCCRPPPRWHPGRGGPRTSSPKTPAHGRPGGRAVSRVAHRSQIRSRRELRQLQLVHHVAVHRYRSVRADRDIPVRQSHRPLLTQYRICLVRHQLSRRRKVRAAVAGIENVRPGLHGKKSAASNGPIQGISGSREAVRGQVETAAARTPKLLTATFNGLVHTAPSPVSSERNVVCCPP